MRTPDEIKKGLECCQLAFGFRECGSRCPYYRDSCCGALLAADALALIQQLQADNAEQAERIRQLEAQNAVLLENIMWMEAERDDFKRAIQQLEAERDAAVADLKAVVSRAALWGVDCQYCKDKGKPVCNNCNWEWRGIQKEE